MRKANEILREVADKRPNYDSDYMDDFVFEGHLDTIYEAMEVYGKEYHKWIKENEKTPFDKEAFEYFWERYHSITKKPKTDKDAAIRYWKKLTKTERNSAVAKIELYFNSIEDKRFVKKCRTYLEDKNFNDEFQTSNIPSVGKNQSIDDIR